MSGRQNVLIDLHAARQSAVELLRSLEQAQRDCEAQLQADNRQDFMRLVRGKSSLEAAIAEARRMIEAVDRNMQEARERTGTDSPGESASTPTPAAPARIKTPDHPNEQNTLEERRLGLVLATSPVVVRPGGGILPSSNSRIETLIDEDDADEELSTLSVGARLGQATVSMLRQFVIRD